MVYRAPAGQISRDPPGRPRPSCRPDLQRAASSCASLYPALSVPRSLLEGVVSDDSSDDLTQILLSTLQPARLTGDTPPDESNESERSPADPLSGSRGSPPSSDSVSQTLPPECPSMNNSSDLALCGRKRRRFADSCEASLTSEAGCTGDGDTPVQTGTAASSTLASSLRKVEETVMVPKRWFEGALSRNIAELARIERETAVQIQQNQSDDANLSLNLTLKIVGYDWAVKNACYLVRRHIMPTAKQEAQLAKCDYEVTLEIPACQIGKVYGIKCKQLQKIRRQTRALVDIDVTSDPCKVTIRGNESSVDRAKHMIHVLTLDAMDDTSDYLFLPRAAAGVILGKGGSRLAELKERSGARIDVDKTRPDVCKVRIAGDTDAAKRAKQLVLAVAFPFTPIRARERI